MTHHDLTLPDGRVLRVHEFGDPSGRPVCFMHGGGLGATGLFAASCEAVARDLGIRLLSPDRPGLGGSSPKGGRSIRCWADDVEVLANRMRLDSFPVISHSGGAGYAMACAWRLPCRVSAVRLVSAMPPRARILRSRGVSLKVKLRVRGFSAMPRFLLTAMFNKIAEDLACQPGKAGRDFVRRLPECERAIMREPAHQDALRACAISAMRQGSNGVVDDLRLIFGEWGFPLDEVKQVVTLWHGDEDATAPPQVAEGLAKALARAELHRVPKAGHLTVWLTRAREILDEA